MVPGDGGSEVRTRRQFHRLCRLRHRHHRTKERRRSDSREPGCTGGESSRDSVSGRPVDRGAGGRAGADRARPARRRQPATGRGVDRLQWSQAAVGRVSRQRGTATGTRGASAADAPARTQRSPALSRSPSGRAAASGAGEGPDVVLWRARTRTRCGDDVHCGGRFRSHHAGRRALRLPNRAGGTAKRHRTRRRHPRGCDAPPDRRPGPDHDRG